MEEYNFPKVFYKCPICGCEDTITKLAMRKIGKEIPDNIYCCERSSVILSEQSTVSLMTKVLYLFYDVCSNCGIKYLVKAEIGSAQLNIVPKIHNRISN